MRKVRCWICGELTDRKHIAGSSNLILRYGNGIDLGRRATFYLCSNCYKEGVIEAL